MNDSPTDIFGTRAAPTDYGHRPLELRCERVSVCCGAEWQEEDAGRCGDPECREGTGFECRVHEAKWENERETVCDDVLI